MPARKTLIFNHISANAASDSVNGRQKVARILFNMLLMKAFKSFPLHKH